MDKKTILLFGVGELQKPIIQRAHRQGLFVVGIDPCENACCRNIVDAFEVVGGQDFEGTIAVARKYHVSAIVTAATDKPLIMMARVAKELGLPFFSEDTARWSTDKYKMKQRFMEMGIPCAKGCLVRSADDAENMSFPVVCKPRDNSGSRGVKLCRDIDELQKCIDEALQFSHLDTVLVEEYIEGKEYSIESLHYEGRTEVIQFTEKQTTEYPYNVELGHIQPADISEENKTQIRHIITHIGDAMQFKNCPSHTELKINDRGIFVIETSPRTGGDFIVSTLTPLSIGVNIEDQLLHIALGEHVDTQSGRIDMAAGIRFFCLPEGRVQTMSPDMKEIDSWPDMMHFEISLSEGDVIKKIKNSLERYGYMIVYAENRAKVNELLDSYEHKINKYITVV